MLVAVPACAVIRESCSDQNCAESFWKFGLMHRLLEEDAKGASSAYATFVRLLLDEDY